MLKLAAVGYIQTMLLGGSSCWSAVKVSFMSGLEAGCQGCVNLRLCWKGRCGSLLPEHRRCLISRGVRGSMMTSHLGWKEAGSEEEFDVISYRFRVCLRVRCLCVSLSAWGLLFEVYVWIDGS
jgi:hypothetical protein